MYQNAPISERVQYVRKLYRTTVPKIDLKRIAIKRISGWSQKNRSRSIWNFNMKWNNESEAREYIKELVTDYYQNHPQEIGILKRAGNLKNLFEKMPVPIRDHERIVGYAGEEFRSSPLFPENSFAWFLNEMDHLQDREVDTYILEEKDREYILETGEFWVKNCMSAAIDAIYPEEYYRDVLGNGVLNYRDHENCQNPIGHFCGNFWTVVDKGLGCVLEEAREKKAALLEKGIRADDARRFEFYRAVEMVTEGIITYTKRYAKEALRLAELCSDEKRKAELKSMADSLNWIMEKPCRN